MKKLLSVLLLAALALSVWGGFSALEGPYRPGDVNDDGMVNIDDILLLRDHIFGVVVLKDEALWAACVAGKNTVTIDDILLVRDHIFGVIDLWDDDFRPPTLIPPLPTFIPDPVNDPLSRAALVGTWEVISSSTAHAWSFNADGTFWNLVLGKLSNPTSTYKARMEGNYEVQGRHIIFTNVIFANKFEYASDAVLPPLNPMDDLYCEFEFIDSARLRIRLAHMETYDIDFKMQDGETVKVPLPTHRIPPAAWPEEILAPGTPRWPGDRIRRVAVGTWPPEAPLVYTNHIITIDRTSVEAMRTYCGLLRNAGWSGPDNDDISKTYYFTFRKGCYYLHFSVDSEDSFRITASREYEGVWPAHLFGDTFKPPGNAVIVGEVPDDKFTSDYNGDLYGNLEMDFYPGSHTAYLESLKTKGFASSENPLNGDEVYRCMRLNGEMYRVNISEYTAGPGSFAKILYRAEYYPAFAWPTDIPADFLPPPGFETLEREGDNDNGVWNDAHDYGSFKFCVAGMKESQQNQYFTDCFAQKGWAKTWLGDGYEKEITWNGKKWRCAIEKWGSSNGITEFRCSLFIKS